MFSFRFTPDTTPVRLFREKKMPAWGAGIFGPQDYWK